MATNGTTQASTAGKKLDFKPVDFDVNKIAPDAPEAQWEATIPAGKIRIQPTKDDKFPMLIIPLRLDSCEEDGEIYQKALGTELSLMVVFFDDTKPRAARMSKLRLQQLCEAADVDREVVPTKIRSPEDFADFIAELERKKFTIWTKHNVDKNTNEVRVDVLLTKPGALRASNDDEEEDDKPAKGKGKAGARKNARA